MGAMTAAQVLSTEIESMDKRLPLLYEKDDAWFTFIDKKPAEVVNDREMRIPLAIRPGGKFGQFSSAGGDLGRGGGSTYQHAVILAVEFKYAKEWQLRTEWVTDDRRKAIVQAVRKEVADAMSEYRKHSDGIALQSGDGVLGTVASTTNAAGVDTVVLDSEYGVKLLRFGQDVNVYDTTLATNRTAAGEREITYHDIPNKTIKFATVTGLVAGDKIVVSGVSGASPASAYGLLYHANDASTGTWLGMDRAAYPEIRANRVNANSSALALPHARLAVNKIGDRLGVDTVVNVVAWLHPCQIHAYEALGQLVSIINKENVKGGLDLYFNDNIRLAGAPVKKHYSWSKKRIDFVDKAIWGRAELKKAQFLDIGGTKVFELRGSSGGVAAGMITYIVSAWNMYANSPPSITYIDGLAIPAGY